MLGGMTRMTISLSIILLEATGNLYFLMPLMLTLMCARWTGNLFNEGIYDMHIGLKRIPFLAPTVPKEAVMLNLRAYEIMTRNLCTLPTLAKVETVYNLLYTTRHSCYPVMYKENGVFGTISRDTLCVLLFNRAFSRTKQLQLTSRYVQSPVMHYKDIEKFFPNFPDLSNVELR